MAINILRIVGAAALSAGGLLIPAGWLLSCCGIVLFIHELYQINTVRRTLWYGVLFGVLYVAIALIWFWNVLPLDWLGASALSGALLTAGSWLAVCLGIGIVYALVAVGFLYVRTRTLLDSLTLSALWVLGEYVHAFSFWLVTWNTESLFGSHFSAAYIGYALASFPPFLYLASIGGIYLLSFALICMATMVYLCVHLLPTLRLRTVAGTTLLGTALILTLSYSPQQNTPSNASGGTLSVALITTRFVRDIPLSVEESRERKEAVLTSVQKWNAEGGTADLLVFPEGGRYSELSTEEARTFAAMSLGKRTAFIDSGIVLENDTLFERAFLRDEEGELRATYDKLFLVPQGEYTPWLAGLILRIPGASALRENIHRAERLYARGETIAATHIKSTPIGMLFCSDILSPHLYRTLVQDGARMLVNASSLAALHGSPLAQHVFLHFAQVRAAETGRFLALSSYQAPASVISNTGVVVTQSPHAPGVSVLSYTVPLRMTETPYVRYGAWVVWASILLCLASLLFRRYMRGTEVA